MLTYTYNAFTVSTVHSLIQCACTKSLQKNSGLWADFTPRRGRESISHCLALPVEGQKKVQAATHFHGEISLSYLQMPATGRIKKGTRSAQKKNLQKITCWEWREKVPGPSQPGKVGTHNPQVLWSELALEAAGEENRFGSLLCSLGPSSPGCRALLSEALTGCAFLAMADCYEMHKQRRRRPSCLQKATYYRIYFAAVCREVKNCIRTDCHFQKNLHSAGLGVFMLWVSLFLFYSYHRSVGSNRHFTASLVSLTVHPSFLFTWCKQMLQKPAPKYDPSPCPNFNACSIFHSALTNTEFGARLSLSGSTASLCRWDWSCIPFSDFYPVP